MMGQTRVQDEENVFSDLPFYTGKNSLFTWSLLVS